MSKYIAATASATFGSTTYKVKSMPTAPEKSTEPVDVTTLDDNSVQRIPGALTDTGDIVLKVQGLTDAPQQNEVNTLTLNLVLSDGSTTTNKTVSCGSCILKSVVGDDIEANGTREMIYTMTFTPSGAAAS